MGLLDDGDEWKRPTPLEDLPEFDGPHEGTAEERIRIARDSHRAYQYAKRLSLAIDKELRKTTI